MLDVIEDYRCGGTSSLHASYFNQSWLNFSLDESFILEKRNDASLV